MRPYIASVREHAPELARQLVDPRGRCNRQGFLALAITLLALQTLIGLGLALFGVAMNSPLAIALNAPLFWVGGMAVLKRLHDMGRTGWWVLAGLIAWVVGAISVSVLATLAFGPLAHGSGAFWVLFAMITVPAFGALLYVHAAPGEMQANRYGAVPGPLGFAPASQRREAVGDMVAFAG
jgi:uncharacterized membrane protein YhaH (DUF805 family)